MALGALRWCACKYEEGHTMNAFLWITALACWSVAALLIAGVVGPGLLERWRLTRHPGGGAQAE